MNNALKSILILTISILPIALHSPAHAVEFDERGDRRIDLPVLSEPNNAITPQISASQSGHVYAVWNDNRGGPLQIYANTFFPDRGWQPQATFVNTTWPRPLDLEGNRVIGDAISPRVCSDNSGHVYVVWVDNRALKAGTGKRDIYFRYSKDYGVTWYPEFIDYQLDSDSPESQIIGDSINPQIACDGDGNVYVVWEDDRNRAGTYEVYFRSIKVPFGKYEFDIKRYQDPEKRLNEDPEIEAGRFSAVSPAISTDKAGNVYVAWQDSRNIPEKFIYNGIYFKAASKHGASWGSEATRIDCSPVGLYATITPVISSDSSGRVYVAWLDNAGRAARGEQFAGDGTYDLYFNRSSDHGATWDATWDKDKSECKGADKRIDLPGKNIEAKDVAIANNNRGVVIIVWADNSAALKKRGISTNFNIYSNHSENYGRTFLDSDRDSDIPIDTGVDPGITNAFNPVVQVDNMGNVFVAWVDNREGTYDIFFNFSIEKGAEDTWEEDMSLEDPEPPGNSFNPVMAIDNLGHVYVAWEDTKRTLARDTYNIYSISGFLDVEILLIQGQRVGEACFIATAAYGSPFESHVKILREFRDRYLIKNSPGRWLVSIYYQLSPPAAQFISDHNYLKPAVRMALLPVVGVAALILHTTTLQKILLIITIILTMICLTFFIFKRNIH